jgi:stearoyl-CoA desaturase (Delta-9 desaturase)
MGDARAPAVPLHRFPLGDARDATEDDARDPADAAPPRGRFRPIEHFSNVLLVLMHLAVLLVFVVPFSGKMIALCAGGYAIRMWAVTAGYHRYFAHRSYKTSRAFQLVLAVLGATAMQNGPLWWASVHRRHHKHSDGPGDPHSPVLRGFWYAHLGWNFDLERPPQDERSNVTDLARYPELGFVDRHDWFFVLAYAFGCLAIGGLPGVVWGFVVSTVAVFHATLRYATDDQSRNNVLVALITFGEGWHNNHHHAMSSARQGFFWWEVDFSYYVLRALAVLGIVWDLREPPAAVLLSQPASSARSARSAAVPPRPASSLR